MRSKSFLRNDDAVSVSLGFILTFAITVIVFVALIISFYSLTQFTEKSAMQDNFKIIGSGLAAKINSADMLVNFTNSNSGTVNMLEYEFSVPVSVAGKTYTINITKSPYKIIFEADNGVRVVSVFNTSTNFTPVLLYSASEYFVIKYNQASSSLYISPETLTPGEVAAMPPGVTNLNYISGPLYINWTWTDPADANFDHVELYVDSNPITTVGIGQQYFNASYFRPNSTHTIYIRTVDIYGYKNTTWMNLLARPLSVFDYVFNLSSITFGSVINFDDSKNSDDGGASAQFYEENISAIPDSHNYTNVASNIMTNGTITNFTNMRNDTDGGAFANLTEVSKNISARYSYSFTPPIINNESWIFSYATSGTGITVSAGSNTTDGVSPGSLFAGLSSTSNQDRYTNTSWRSPNFTWTNGTPLMAILNFSFRVTQLTQTSTTATSAVYIMNPNGVKKQINQSTTYTAAGAWGNFSNSSIVLTDFSIKGNYSILLNATLFTTDNNAAVNVSWDNPTITLYYTSYNLNITTNTTNVQTDTNYYLEINYSRDSNETGYNVSVFNGTGWTYKGNLTNSSWSLTNFTLSSSEVINGNVSVRYTDQTPTGTNRSNLSIDYQRLHGFTAGLPAGDYLDITTNTFNITEANTSSVLQLNYTVSGDNFTVLIKNGTTSGWDAVSILNTTGMPYRNITLTQNELLPDGTIPGGNMPAINKYYVQVRYRDESASKNGTLNIDYQRIYSS